MAGVTTEGVGVARGVDGFSGLTMLELVPGGSAFEGEDGFEALGEPGREAGRRSVAEASEGEVGDVAALGDFFWDEDTVSRMTDGEATRFS